MNGNYYVWCGARSYSARLLDDFQYDALMLIHDVEAFSKRLAAAVKAVRPDLRMSIGNVRYYDPYFVDISDVWIPMLKHLRYAYQAEVRYVWTSAAKAPDWTPLFVEVGALNDIARLYEL